MARFICPSTDQLCWDTSDPSSLDKWNPRLQHLQPIENKHEFSLPILSVKALKKCKLSIPFDDILYKSALQLKKILSLSVAKFPVSVPWGQLWALQYLVRSKKLLSASFINFQAISCFPLAAKPTPFGRYWNTETPNAAWREAQLLERGGVTRR